MSYHLIQIPCFYEVTKLSERIYQQIARRSVFLDLPCTHTLFSMNQILLLLSINSVPQIYRYKIAWSYIDRSIIRLIFSCKAASKNHFGSLSTLGEYFSFFGSRALAPVAKLQHTCNIHHIICIYHIYIYPLLVYIYRRANYLYITYIYIIHIYNIYISGLIIYI